MSDDFRKKLDLEPIISISTDVAIPKSSVEADFEFSRATLYDIIGKGQEAIEDMIDIARKSSNPRAYEVLNSMLRNIVDANKDLLELQQRKQKLTGEQPENPQTVNNNLFVGSTAELAAYLENNKKDKNES